MYLGLGRWISMRYRGVPFASIVRPFGWRFMKVESRAAFILMPLWLYWPVQLWRERWWLTAAPLERIGLFQLKEEGGYWHKGRLRFDFWNVFAERYTKPLYQGPMIAAEDIRRANVFGRMERLGWFIARHIKQFNETMPRWSA